MGFGFFYDMPIGQIFIAEDGIGINKVTLAGDINEEDLKKYTMEETKLIKETAGQLREYFEGIRKEFTISLNPQGSSFQKKVWEALLQIPYGETRSYKEIAQIIGNKKGSQGCGNGKS